MNSLYVVVLAIAFAVQACTCVELLEGDIQQELREVIVDSAGASVVGVIGGENDRVNETPWKGEEITRTFFGQTAEEPEVPYNGFLGSITLFDTTSPWLHSMWSNLLDGTMLSNFYQRCDQEPGYEEGITRNLGAMQAFVAFVVIGYTAVAMWIGPITLSRWQRRTLLATYAQAGLVQVIFLFQVFGLLAVRSAYPLTMTITMIFFLTFNCTNTLLLLESEAEATDVQQIIESSPTRVVTSQRARCY